MKTLFAIILFLLLFQSVNGRAAMVRSDMVRVAVLKGAETVKIDGNGLLAVDDNGNPVIANVPLVVKRGSGGVIVNGNPVHIIRVSSPASLQVNGKGYRGIIEIVPGEKGVLVIDELPLEDYLVGLINCEISSQWPLEAIKAQAVIARSYALYQMENRKNSSYHLESSVLDQVYSGCDIEDSRAAMGVRETAGEVVTFNGKVIQAFYHSNCGGHTEAAENVWGAPLPYLKGVDCKYCLAAKTGNWEQTLPLKKIEALLRSNGIQISGLRDIKSGQRNRSGRLNEIVLFGGKGKQAIPAVNFRKAVGFGTIKSTNFTINVVGDDAFFSGIGYGHGVGLCQWGAKQRAEDGFDYREILTYYYPGTRVEKSVLASDAVKGF